MRYSLKRPCAHCPFRTDRPGYLRQVRAFTIGLALICDQTFACHETTVEGEPDEDGFEDTVVTDQSQFCAGAMLFLLAHGGPNFPMREAISSGELDLDTLDRDAPVARSLEDFTRHHNE